MNKAILMSIQPKWLVKILNGEKTIEIRKTMPKCDLPIDVYLYCTKGHWSLHRYEHDGKWFIGFYKKLGKSNAHNGKVIAKFTLNKVEEITLEEVVTDNFGLDETDYHYMTDELQENELLKKSCLTSDELFEYVGWEENGYAYYIDNLVIFDKPMELSEFEKEEYYSTPNGWFPSFQSLTKAPQSWQYVYVKGDKYEV